MTSRRMIKLMKAILIGWVIVMAIAIPVIAASAERCKKTTTIDHNTDGRVIVKTHIVCIKN